MLIGVASEPVLYLGLACNGLATDVIETLHRLVQSHPPDVEVRVGLADVGVPEHFLHVMYRTKSRLANPSP